MSSGVSSSGGNFAVKPTHPSAHLSTNSSSGGSFYKQASTPVHSPVAQPASSTATVNSVPAKKPAISVRGRCVLHTEGRFRIEVGYHAELIAVFKSVSSKSYGWCLLVSHSS